jgi:hypothetical protein
MHRCTRSAPTYLKIGELEKAKAAWRTAVFTGHVKQELYPHHLSERLKQLDHMVPASPTKVQKKRKEIRLNTEHINSNIDTTTNVLSQPLVEIPNIQCAFLVLWCEHGCRTRAALALLRLQTALVVLRCHHSKHINTKCEVHNNGEAGTKHIHRLNNICHMHTTLTSRRGGGWLIFSLGSVFDDF